jgi:hypothetical protein
MKKFEPTVIETAGGPIAIQKPKDIWDLPIYG